MNEYHYQLETYEAVMLIFSFNLLQNEIPQLVEGLKALQTIR